MCGFHTLWKWRLSKLNQLIKINRVAVNTHVNLEKIHCIVFCRFGITSYHKNPKLKNYLKIHQFTKGAIKSSSRAKLETLHGQKVANACAMVF